MEEMPKISIGIPSTGTIRIETALSLVAATANTPGVMFNLLHQTSCYIHLNREEIVLDAQKEKATHLMFIDADMAFPQDAVATLLKRDKPIIGANYNYRQYPLRSVTVLDPKLTGGVKFSDDAFGDKDKVTVTIDMPKDPFKCRAVGTGFMMIQMWVFDKIQRPWFFYRPEVINNVKVGTIGDDVWFCDRAREQNIEVWCDPTIQMKHIGIGVY